MKLSGIAGKGSGRVGSNVYAVSGGVQVVRQYNPNVTNPSTPAQVAQRSRLKLASQVAAAMADVIAIPKSGLVSSRNAFMKRNFDLFVGSEDGASCQYAKLQLTASSVGLPSVSAEKSDEQTLSIELTSDARAVATRVIYNVFAKTTEQQLMKIASRVVTEAGENGTFPIEVTTSATELVVYAYGMRDMSTTATAKYGNYHVQSGEDIAKLVANRRLSAADYTFTNTQGFDLIPWENPYPGASLTYTTDEDEISVDLDELSSNVIETDLDSIGLFWLEHMPDDDNVLVKWVDMQGAQQEAEMSSTTEASGKFRFDFPAGTPAPIKYPIEVYVNDVLYFRIEK